MMQCRAKKILNRERGVSFHFPVTHLNSPSIFETTNSMLGSVLKVEGVPFDTEDDALLNEMKQTWHQAIMGLSSDVSLTVSMHRRREINQLEGRFKQGFLKDIDRKYHQTIRQKTLFVNDIYITVLTRGLREHGFSGILKGLSNKAMALSRELWRVDQIALLNKSVNQLKSLLAAFGPVVLGESDHVRGYSELIRFVSLFVNGCIDHQHRFPRWLSPITVSMKADLSEQAYYPCGHIGAYISNRRLFFGDVIQFQETANESIRYASMVSVKRYPALTTSRIMDNLLKIDCEYLSTHSFYIEPKESVQRLINRHRRKMENVNDPAHSQIAALEEARDQLASDKICMGQHHNTVMLQADSLEQLKYAVTQMIKHYAEAGFIAVEETIGKEPAFWSQIPGNLKMISRSAIITSENFVDFCPLHNYRTGFRDENHLGSAVTILKTPSNTPFFFNFHVKGSSRNPSKGHTLVVGGNGSGKTVAMAFFDAQLSRYGGRSFVFDRDHGLEIYLRACGGYYATLTPDQPDAVSFNPFQLPDTAVNRRFCREWLGQLVINETEVALPADVIDWLTQCVDYVYEALPREKRHLSNASKLLPIHFSRWTQLRRWLRSDGKYPDGEYAYLFDNPKDDFQWHDKMGFDFTHFLDHEPRTVLVALTMYLFHRLEQSLDGRLVSILLDEGWQYLDNPYWIQKLKKWLPTLRKLNCHLILATQSPSSIIESPIKNTLLDNVATQIYFINPQAKKEQYQLGFNLTDNEFKQIKHGDLLNRYFLLKQEHESCVCQLDLSEISEFLSVFSGNRQSLNVLSSLRNQYGEDPKEWLPPFLKRINQC